MSSGQADPLSLLPDDLDVVFISSYTQSSALAYTLAVALRRRGALTVIGGPHARAFPTDCLRFFDIVVKDCDRALIDDILEGRIDPPAAVTSGRPLTTFPTVEERLIEITTASFHRGRPLLTSVIPMLSSIGCPYSCSFCVDWNSRYVALPREQLEADLSFISRHFPKVIIGYHDPNFAVRFDETMDVIESLPEGRRNPYIMESSLSILNKKGRLERLRRTNCAYAAPGIESWDDYANKSGAGAARGRAKLEEMVKKVELLSQHVPGVQANFLFGSDTDRGDEPATLTKEFIERLPAVWPTINIPSPFGGTPLYDQLYREGRILRAMPFAFYYNPFLAITLENYDPPAYYDHLIDMHEAITSNAMLWRRITVKARPTVRFAHSLRTIATRGELAQFRKIRNQLREDAQFRAFHEGRDDRLPSFYGRDLWRRLGRYAELLSDEALRPVLEPPAATLSASGTAAQEASLPHAAALGG